MDCKCYLFGNRSTAWGEMKKQSINAKCSFAAPKKRNLRLEAERVAFGSLFQWQELHKMIYSKAFQSSASSLFRSCQIIQISLSMTVFELRLPSLGLCDSERRDITIGF